MTVSAEALPLPDAYEPREDTFKGRRVLVCGASGEIGARAATSLAECGARLALLGRTQRRLEKVAQRVAAAHGAEPLVFTVDYRQASWDSYAEIADRIEGQMGGLDAWFHASAELGPLVSLEHYPPTRWATAMHINLNVPFLLAQHLTPLLRRSTAAAVLFTLADCVWRGKAYWSAFAAANQGLRGLIESLADELEQEGRVRVNGLVPGPVNSRLWRAAYPALPPDQLPALDHILPGVLSLLAPRPDEPSGRIYTAAS